MWVIYVDMYHIRHYNGGNFIFFKGFIYPFLDRGEGREKERERNINVCLPLEHPHWEPGLQPRHVP